MIEQKLIHESKQTNFIYKEHFKQAESPNNILTDSNWNRGVKHKDPEENHQAANIHSIKYKNIKYNQNPTVLDLLRQMIHF